MSYIPDKITFSMLTEACRNIQLLGYRIPNSGFADRFEYDGIRAEYTVSSNGTTYRLYKNGNNGWQLVGISYRQQGALTISGNETEALDALTLLKLMV